MVANPVESDATDDNNDGDDGMSTLKQDEEC